MCCKWMSSTRQVASPRRAPSRKPSTLLKTSVSKPCTCSTRCTARRIPGSSSTTMTRWRVPIVEDRLARPVKALVTSESKFKVLNRYCFSCPFCRIRGLFLLSLRTGSASQDRVGSAGLGLSFDLGWLLHQNPEALCNQHEVGNRRNVQLVHDVAAMSLDRPLRRSKLTRNLLVHLSPSDPFKHLSLARCQAVHELLQRMELLVLLPPCAAAGNRPLN